MKKIKKMRSGGMASRSSGPGGGMMGGSGSGGPSSRASSGGRASASGGMSGGMSSAGSSGRASASSGGKSSGRSSSKYASGGIVKAPAKSYKDMRAGSGGGTGRIQKTKIQRGR